MSDIGSRIAVCRLIEKMEKYPAYCEKLGISNASRFRGKSIKKNDPSKRKEYQAHEQG